MNHQVNAFLLKSIKRHPIHWQWAQFHWKIPPRKPTKTAKLPNCQTAKWINGARRSAVRCRALDADGMGNSWVKRRGAHTHRIIICYLISSCCWNASDHCWASAGRGHCCCGCRRWLSSCVSAPASTPANCRHCANTLSIRSFLLIQFQLTFNQSTFHFLLNAMDLTTQKKINNK